MIDSYYARRLARKDMEKQKLADFRERDLRGKAAWVARRLRGLWFKIRTRARWVAADAMKGSGIGIEGIMTVQKATQRARLAYDPDPAPVHVKLFRCVEEGRDWTRPLAFWNELAEGGLDVYELDRPGIRHDNVLNSPYARDLADALDEVVEKVLEEDEVEPFDEVLEQVG